MRIKDVKIEKHKIKLVKPFRISIGVIEDFWTMLIKVETDEGIYGIGEGSPLEIITGETIEATLSAAAAIRDMVLGRDPSDIENINSEMEKLFPGNPSARAAYDIALHDICAKKAGLPLYKYLGGTRNTVTNDITIAIDTLEQMVAKTREYVDSGYKILKIKVGRNIDEDLNVVAAIREAAGKSTIIFIDANQGWDLESAPSIINRLSEYDLLLVEQPLPKNDIEGFVKIKEKVKVPLMADESVFTPEDAKKIAQLGAADFINIKLMKCGGIFNASRINSISENAGIRCIIGCMIDSPVAITAAASFASVADNVLFCDLDSLLHIKECGIRGGVLQKPGSITLLDEPGLGIDIDF